MADFSIRATQLSNPQGAGSQPIRPVQGPADFTPDLSGLGGLLSGLVSQKKEADPWSPSVDEFTKRNAAITQAQQTGDLSAASAKVQRNKLVTEFQVRGADAGWGVEYQKTLSQLVGYVATGSGTAEADSLVQEEQKAQQDMYYKGVNAGVVRQVEDFTALTDREQRATLNTMQAFNYLEAQAKSAEEERSRVRAANGETRAQVEADRKAEEYTRQRQAQAALQDAMSKTVETIDAQIAGIAQDSRYTTADQRKMAMEGVLTGLQTLAQPILMGDQAAMNAYSGMLDRYRKLSGDYFDPTKRTAEVESELKRITTLSKLALLQDPKMLEVHSVSTLFPNAHTLQIEVGNVLAGWGRDLKSASQSKPLTSVVTGDIPTQKATFATAREGVRRSMDGVTPEAQTTFNHSAEVFASTVKSITTFRPGQNNSMEYVLEAVASPEYAAVVKKGAFNTNDGVEAMENIVNVYVPAFADNLRNSLQVPIGDTRYEGGKPSVDNASLMQLVDFNVNADGTIQITKIIHPEFRKNITASDLYIDGQIKKLQRQLEPQINQLIRATAHLEGTTDYKAVFERVAPTMLRGFYAPASFMEELKAQGYSGTGNVNNPANWKGTSGIPSQRNTAAD